MEKREGDNFSDELTQKTADRMSKIALLDSPEATQNLHPKDLMNDFDKLLTLNRNSLPLNSNLADSNQSTQSSVLNLANPSSSPPTITLIRDLSMGFSQSTIKVRVSYKSSTIDNTFVIDIIDKELSEARISFEDDLCIAFQRVVSEGRIYFINNLYATKPFAGSRRKFTLQATPATTVTVCAEEQSFPCIAPEKVYQVSEIDDSLESQTFDIVLRVWKLGSKKMRHVDSQPMFVRDVWLTDRAEDKILLTLWNHMIDRFNFEEGEIVLCRGMRRAAGELRLISSGDTAFITTGIERYEAWFDDN